VIKNPIAFDRTTISKLKIYNGLRQFFSAWPMQCVELGTVAGKPYDQDTGSTMMSKLSEPGYISGMAQQAPVTMKSLPG
jgi:hypothetical protein